jgi:hypothetical protein
MSFSYASALNKDKSKPFKPLVKSQALVAPKDRVIYAIDFLLSFRLKCVAYPAGLAAEMPANGFLNDAENLVLDEDGNLVDSKLHSVGENRWKITTATGDDAVLRSAQSILNKLTVDKFDKLCVDFCNLEITSVDLLTKVVEMVVFKAQVDNHFAAMYADLCLTLSDKKFEFEASADGEKDSSAFKKVLLTTVGNEFFNGLEEKNAAAAADAAGAAVASGEVEGEEDSGPAVNRGVMKTLGNIKFIGELFKQKMLKSKRIHEILVRLFGDYLLKRTVPDDVQLECICRLLYSVGKTLDDKKNADLVAQYLHALSEIAKLEGTSSRIRFMIEEIVEMKLNAWVPRREESRILTLAELHAESERANKKRSKAPVVTVDEDGWITTAVQPALPKPTKRATVSLASESEKSSKSTSSSDSKKKGPKKGGKVKELPVEEVRTKAKAIFRAYCARSNNEEVFELLHDLNTPSMLAEFISTGVNMTMEQNDAERASFVAVVTVLIKQKIVKQEIVGSVFVDLFEQLDDISLDVPQAGLYMAKFLGQFAFAEVLSLKFLKEALLPRHVEGNKAANIVGEVIREIYKACGNDKEHTKALMYASDISAEDYIKYEANDTMATYDAKVIRFMTSYMK